MLIAAWAMLAAASLAAHAAVPADPHTVTARPPLEAVPATPAARAQQAKLRRCTAAARTKHLRGKPREAFVRRCMTPERPAPAAARPPAR